MNKPTTIDELFPSPYLKHDDIGDQDMALTISNYDFEAIGVDQPEMKGVLYFEETDKKLVLNKTNAGTISEIYGKEITQWVGKPIALYKTEVSFAGRTVWGVRVRKNPPTKPQPAQVQQEAPQSPPNWVD